MQWCLPFPEEQVLVIRPSLLAICAGQHSAAKLLSVLLYHCSIRAPHLTNAQQHINTHRQSSEPLDVPAAVPVIHRTQAQLIRDLCGELTKKTLHDVAIPTLQLLGYLDLDPSSPIHRYTIHLEVIRTALAAYRQGSACLEPVLLRHLQREKFRIEAPGEKMLMDKHFFHYALEKILLVNRTSSPSQRGPKPREEADSARVLEPPKNQREIQEKKKERVWSGDGSVVTPPLARVTPPDNRKQDVHVPCQNAGTMSAQITSSTLPTQERIEPHCQPHRGASATTTASVPPDHLSHSGSLTRSHPAEGKRERAVFTSEGRQIYEAWCSLFKVAVPESEAIIRAANRLAPLVTPWAESLQTTPPEVLKDIKTWMYATDTRGYYQRGIKLFDVLRDFEGWQSVKERGSLPHPSKPHAQAPSNQAFLPTSQKETDRAREDPYSLEALLARQERNRYTTDAYLPEGNRK